MLHRSLAFFSSTSFTSGCSARRARTIVSAGLIATLTLVPLTGCASAAGPRQLRVTHSADPKAASDWSRVLALPATAAVLLTVRDAEPRTHWVIGTDASSLTVLDLSDQTVPRAVARVLLAMAADRPESFTAMGRGQMFQQGSVRIGRDGVFVDDRQVAEFHQVVQSIRRDDVLEICIYFF